MLRNKRTILRISIFAAWISICSTTVAQAAQQENASLGANQLRNPENTNRGFPVLPAAATAPINDVPQASYANVQFSPTTTNLAPTPTQQAAAPSPSSKKSIAIPPRGSSNDKAQPRPASSVRALVSVATSLAIVLLMFFGVATLYKKSQASSGSTRLPSDVVQLLGRTTAGPRQSLVVLKFGSKLVLVSQQPGQTETLSEITDADEVERLTKICSSRSDLPAQTSFANVFKQVAGISRKDA